MVSSCRLGSWHIGGLKILVGVRKLVLRDELAVLVRRRK